jgi:SWI/SNF-related matrix-associated actin-dependent regulator 1 of chromatin subfamily A
MDEIHYIKNNGARRTKATKLLAKGIPHVIGLSGTPIVNRPIEAYNAIKMIDPDLFTNGWEYAHRYCGARNNGYGWDFSGATNTEELHQKLVESIMIRRKKVDVLTDLPEKLYSFVPIELDNEKEYKAAEDDFIEFVHKTKGAVAAERASNAATLAEIEGLKQLAVKGKMAECIDWIKDFIEVDGKLVVFATHKFVIDSLMEAFPNISVKIDGSVTGEERQQSVDKFQNDSNIRLFVGNIKAAGVGITLTAASNVAFIELPWTPGDLVQAEDRCHRIGQKSSVNIHYLLSSGTIEERIARLLDKKRKVLDAVLDGKETEQESLLSELMKEFE